jgi:hypothetical protein
VTSDEAGELLAIVRILAKIKIKIKINKNKNKNKIK